MQKNPIIFGATYTRKHDGKKVYMNIRQYQEEINSGYVRISDSKDIDSPVSITTIGNFTDVNLYTITSVPMDVLQHLPKLPPVASAEVERENERLRVECETKSESLRVYENLLQILYDSINNDTDTLKEENDILKEKLAQVEYNLYMMEKKYTRSLEVQFGIKDDKWKRYKGVS